MRKYKYLIASSFLIILMIFIFIPRPSEKIYVLFDKNEIQCDSNIIRENWQKGSFLICDDFKFINFIENPKEKSLITDLNKIDKFEIISKKELLKRFNHNKVNKEKNNFDLLDRDKKIDFNLVIKDTILKKLEIIPVVQSEVYCLLKLTD